MDSLIAANITQRPLRTAISIIGVALGVILVTLFVGLARGMMRDAARRLRFPLLAGSSLPVTWRLPEVELSLGCEIEDALMVPTQAVIPVLRGQTVLIRRNGVVASVPVKIGTRTATHVQVVSGLSPGDTVLTTGIMQLRPGMPVTVTVK